MKSQRKKGKKKGEKIMKKNILAIGMAAIGVLGAVTLAGCNGGEEGAGAA